ncbi:hypothetical protein EV363DRAFT_1228376 [Boletus edulis]|nr:hypothetical protein EV363DRAFT_1228376 [Boletus edulis]
MQGMLHCPYHHRTMETDHVSAQHGTGILILMCPILCIYSQSHKASMIHRITATCSCLPRLHPRVMSSVQSVLALLRLNDYFTLGIATAVIYDYCITISNEVTYIWVCNRHSSKEASYMIPVTRRDPGRGCLRCSFSFVMWAVLLPYGSTFIPGPVTIRHSSPISRYTISILIIWGYMVFYMAADMVMILRVYAIYNRSKIILGVLLVLYFAELVLLIVNASVYSDPTYIIASVTQLLDFMVCSFTLTTQTWNIAAVTIQCILGTFLCILVVAKFMRESLQMHQTTGKWQMNRYLRLLLRDGFLYFLISLLYGLNILGVLGILPSEGYVAGVLQFVSDVPLFTLTPRFVINIRELYVLDTHGCWDHDIDTGFGLSSGRRRGMGMSTTIGTIAFAEPAATGGLEDEEVTAAAEERAASGKQVLQTGGSDIEVPV